MSAFKVAAGTVYACEITPGRRYMLRLWAASAVSSAPWHAFHSLLPSAYTAMPYVSDPGYVDDSLTVIKGLDNIDTNSEAEFCASAPVLVVTNYDHAGGTIYGALTPITNRD